MAWRLPEVNIGIFCANAPVLRPLYLAYRGRLATQRDGRASSGGKGYGASSSKNRILPHGAGWGRVGTKLPSHRDDESWKRGSGSGSGTVGTEETAVEMGLAGVGKGGEVV